MGFADLIAENQRSSMLLLLHEDSGAYTLNESMLQDCLAYVGVKCSRDAVRTQLAWLKEQGLVTLDDSMGFYVATLTDRGIDAATAVVTVPGVKRPRPRG